MSLSATEKSLLDSGLWFLLTSKKLNYADYVTSFKLFYRSIQNLDVLSNGDLDFVKSKIKDAALGSFWFYNTNVLQNLYNQELEALDKLSKNKNLVVQKADKGNSVVLVDRDVYVKHIENVLEDNTKFEVGIKTRILNFQVNHEKRANEILKSLKYSGSLNDKQHKKLKQLDLELVLYMTFVKFTAFVKFTKHKAIVDVCLTFRPMLSAIETPIYKIAKFLVPILSCLTINDFTVKDSFSVGKEIVEQDSNFYMVSLDVDCLLTNIPLEETIDISTQLIYNQNDSFQGLNI